MANMIIEQMIMVMIKLIQPVILIFNGALYWTTSGVQNEKSWV